MSIRLNEFVLIAVLVCAAVFVLTIILLLIASPSSRVHARRATSNRAKYREMLLSASEGAMDAPPSGAVARREMSDLAVHLLSNTVGEERQQLADWLLRWDFDRNAEKWMRSRSPAQRLRGAVLLLLSKGEAAAPRALPLLSDAHPRVRAGVARALGYVGTEGAVPAIMRGIESDMLPPSIGMMSILRIYPRDAKLLEAGMRSDSATLRRVLASSAGMLEMRSLREPVEALLDDADAGVRLAAIETLGRFADPASTIVLQQRSVTAMDDQERAAIEWALDSCRVVDDGASDLEDPEDHEAAGVPAARAAEHARQPVSAQAFEASLQSRDGGGAHG